MKQSVEFPLISGNLALDLVNTEVVRWGTQHELLLSSNEILLWLHTMEQHGHLLPQQIVGNHREYAEELFESALQIRPLIRKGLEAMIADEKIDSDWVKLLESFVEKAPMSYHLHKSGLLPVPIGNPGAAFQSLIALDALKLLAGEHYKLLRRCTNPECVLLFMDASGRRKWCSMKICGNRAKVARHHEQRQNHL